MLPALQSRLLFKKRITITFKCKNMEIKTLICALILITISHFELLSLGQATKEKKILIFVVQVGYDSK